MPLGGATHCKLHAAVSFAVSFVSVHDNYDRGEEILLKKIVYIPREAEVAAIKTSMGGQFIAYVPPNAMGKEICGPEYSIAGPMHPQ